MKRSAIFGFLAAVLLFFSFSTDVPAAGTCSVSTKTSDEIMEVTWSYTADASDASYPSTGCEGPVTRGWVFNVDIVPGATAPTSGASFTLNTGPGVDVLSGNGSGALLGSSKNRVVPAKNGWIPATTLNPVITGNSVNSASVSIVATIWLQKR